MKLTTGITNEEFKVLADRYLKGEISSDEKSRMTPALVKKLDRFAKHHKRG